MSNIRGHLRVLRVTSPARPRLWVVGSRGSDDGLLDDFGQWLRSWGAAESTVSVRLRVMSAALATWPEPADIEAHHLERWLGSRDLSAWSRVTYYGHARSFFGWLRDSGRIESDPTAGLRRPKAPRGTPRPLTEDQVVGVLDSAQGRTRAYVMLALFAGLRAHEIAKLRGEDVTEQAIYVEGKGGQRALIPTHPALWTLAREHPRSGWWFPSHSARGHVTTEAVTAGVTRLFRSLGIEGSVHRCRHTYATRLLRGGANIRVVQTLMRHQSLTSTEVYTAVDDAERAQAIAALGGGAA